MSMNVNPTPAKTQSHVKMISMISNAVAARVTLGRDVTDAKILTIATLVMVRNNLLILVFPGTNRLFFKVAVWAEAE